MKLSVQIANGSKEYDFEESVFTWKELLTEEDIDLPDMAQIYVIHDRVGEIVYIGKSVSPHERLLTHVGAATALPWRKEPTQVGRYIRENMPESGSWIVKILQAREDFESRLIRQYRPYFNDGNYRKEPTPAPAETQYSPANTNAPCDVLGLVF